MHKLVSDVTTDTYGGPGLFFSSRRRHTRSLCDWSSDVCSSDLRIGDEVGAREGWLRHEEQVVVLPVPAALAGAARGPRGGLGVAVEAQREVLVDEAHLAGKVGQHLAQRLLDPSAVGSLVVGELDD